MMSNNKTHIPTVKREVRYRYVPVQETLQTEDNAKYVTYGISVRTVEDEVAFVSDISTEFEEVSRLADICTAQELDPEQLGDVIEDFLAEGSVSLT